MKAFLWPMFIVLFLTACQSPNLQVQAGNNELDNIITDYQNFKDNQSPLNQDIAGASNRQLPDLSPLKLAQQHQELKLIFQRLSKVNTATLDQAQAINHAVLSYTIRNQLDNYINKEHYMPLTAESGFHVWISRINSQVNFKTEQDYRDYLARLQALPQYFSQQMYWMDQGIKAGITQPQVVLHGFEESIKAFIKTDATKSSYYSPFISLPEHFSASLQAELRGQASDAITQAVFPSYQKYYDYMVQRYQPNARADIAASALPNGQQYYLNRLQHYTTLDTTVDAVHETGLLEVQRIRNEMENIIAQLGFDGSFADFVHFLRTDKQFYVTSPEALLKEASYIAKKMDEQLPRFFKTLPRTPYGVVEVPANIAPKYTTGRYSGPSRDDQAGQYWVNTYRLDRRPLYVLEALTLHEAVPGHHLQGSIAREMQNVPKFRNSTYISAFGEGWGLYSEYLGIEAGFYQDPYSDFGRLTYEMWRACRLVVDTGMHAKGWSREQAMNYLADNTALSLHNVKTEIDRYISWPGQALSYKMGELTIKKLRNKAEKALGENFDLREFHDQVLKNGSMPLSMLETIIVDYIEKKQAQTKA
ncbi:Uncharacterized conserved protein, DUF885 familyt [Colwellia chukchiensis]|uniref:Uncharacterized conserved protein, DUF885 familyt n=1 Tax=Colwellia chukchiensis TaxID=641665 RepID=A0A1H7P7R4_9GAMM|nr:DUF885 domain-containing protein [Colwellia chukchiensis]SEL31127.1 Uncharacterized conserved protein, DUF885 familyt [Colwellia chukchiensis]